jgi:hypothetical protein
MSKIFWTTKEVIIHSSGIISVSIVDKGKTETYLFEDKRQDFPIDNLIIYENEE